MINLTFDLAQVSALMFMGIAVLLTIVFAKWMMAVSEEHEKKYPEATGSLAPAAFLEKAGRFLMGLSLALGTATLAGLATGNLLLFVFAGAFLLGTPGFALVGVVLGKAALKSKEELAAMRPALPALAPEAPHPDRNRARRNAARLREKFT